MTNVRYPDRRRFLQGLTAAGLAAFTTRGVFAQQLVETGTTTEGPFYPDKLPLDTDNDSAHRQRRHHAGRRRDHAPHWPGAHDVGSTGAQRVRRDLAGRPDRLVRAHWRASANRIRQELPGLRPLPQRCEGPYYFRTIKPIDYTLIGIFRTAHIHFAVSQNGRRVFTSQMLVNGHPANARDGVIAVLDQRALKTLLVDFKPLPGSKLGELTANFDIVLGSTINELEVGPLRGVAPSTRRRSGGG